ncbi:hypothetical protein GGF42_002013, partial [Coemansia sp. RSA 2424]
MSFLHSLNVRKFTPGPEDPSEMLAEGDAVIRSRYWLFRSALGVAGGLSGLVFAFLAIVFIWRRSLVDRVSLRLIALISFIYLSSSIAFNLQMVFLRKSRSPLPRYAEYLYYIVSLTMLVMCSLCTKKRAITRVLNSVSHEPKSLLSGSNPSTAQDNLSASASQTLVSVSPKERQQLKLARSVYKVSIRIALYPIAPLFCLVLYTIYYVKQYFVTLTYRSDIIDYVWLTTMGYFIFPGIAFINFAIFLADPAVVKVIAEIRQTIRIKM